MKSIHLIGCLFLLIGCDTSFACDLHSYYLGINPAYNKNTVGLRYRYRSYSGEHSHTGNDNEPTHTHSPNFSERYNTYEIWGRWYPSPKIQLLLSLPYSNNYELDNKEIVNRVIGIGDITLLGQYQLYNTPVDDTVSFKQRLFAGAGLKFPTGLYDKANANGETDPLLQSGTGSFDFLGSITYLAKFRNTGISANIVYKFNTPNKNDYVFANRMNMDIHLFYQQKIKSFTLTPNTGIYLEQAGKDLDKNTYRQNTGGSVLFGSMGLDIYHKKMSLNLVYQIPLYENLFGEQGKNKNRIMIGVNYAFN